MKSRLGGSPLSVMRADWVAEYPPLPMKSCLGGSPLSVMREEMSTEVPSSPDEELPWWLSSLGDDLTWRLRTQSPDPGDSGRARGLGGRQGATDIGRQGATDYMKALRSGREPLKPPLIYGASEAGSHRSQFPL